MENSDKPINPAFIGKNQDGKNFLVTDEEASNGFYSASSLGLTKREYFATSNLQGLLASNRGQSTIYLVKEAVEAADELLKELEKAKTV